MASPSRMTRMTSNQGRMKKKVQYLSQEIERLGAQGFSDFAEEDSPFIPRAISEATPSGSSFDDLLDKVIDITKKWEKILALLALVTTNLSGNKSLSALLEIMAKDRPEFGGGPSGQSTGAGGLGGLGAGGLNLTELLNMAEGILKNSQLQQESAIENQAQADPVPAAQEEAVEISSEEATSEEPLSDDELSGKDVETPEFTDDIQEDNEAGDVIEADPVA